MKIPTLAEIIAASDIATDIKTLEDYAHEVDLDLSQVDIKDASYICAEAEAFKSR